MKQAERDENRANRKRYLDRINELEARSEELGTQISAVALDSALGGADAVAKEGAAKQELAGLSDQIGTLQREIERLDADYEADRPEREEEERVREQARLEAEAKVAALAHLAISERADEIAKELAAVLEQREESGRSLRQFRAVIGSHGLHPLSDIFGKAMAAAGLARLIPEFRENPMGPNTFTEADAHELQLVVSSDHPARIAVKPRLEAASAAAKRERGEWDRVNRPKSFDDHLSQPGVTLVPRRF